MRNELWRLGAAILSIAMLTAPLPGQAPVPETRVSAMVAEQDARRDALDLAPKLNAFGEAAKAAWLEWAGEKVREGEAEADDLARRAAALSDALNARVGESMHGLKNRLRGGLEALTGRMMR